MIAASGAHRALPAAVLAAGLLLPAAYAGGEPGRARVEPHLFKAPDGREIRGELRRLRVPENRADPGSATIEIAFVRLPSSSARPGLPVLYLAGGPGNSGIANAAGRRWALFDALLRIGDVVLLDQRGTGLSSPNLICPDSWRLPRDQPLEPAALSAAVRERAAACARRLAGKGVDLSAYNAREMADDVEAIRDALGEEKIRLLATSYGTHLALAVLRRHGAAMGAAVLAGVVGPDHTYRLPHAVEGALAVASGGDLVARISEITRRLDELPVTLKALDPFGNREVEVVAGGLDLRLATLRRLNGREQILELVSAYREMAEGDFSRLGEDFLKGKRGWLGLVMPYAVACASGVSDPRRRRIAEQAPAAVFGRLADFPFPEICEALGIADLGDEWREPVRSEVPALFVSGTLDARTPVENAVQVLEGFPNGRQLVVEGAGHGDDLLATPEIIEEIVRFFQGEPRVGASGH